MSVLLQSGLALGKGTPAPRNCEILVVQELRLEWEKNKPELALQGQGPNKRELKKLIHGPFESQAGALRRLRAGMGGFTAQ